VITLEDKDWSRLMYCRFSQMIFHLLNVSSGFHWYFLMHLVSICSLSDETVGVHKRKKKLWTRHTNRHSWPSEDSYQVIRDFWNSKWHQLSLHIEGWKVMKKIQTFSYYGIEKIPGILTLCISFNPS